MAARRVLVAGATSAIAQETCKLLAQRGDRLFLVARDGSRLAIVAQDLEVRGAQRVATLVADLDDVARHAEIVAAAESALEGFDTVLVAHGVLGDQAACQRDYRAAEAVLRTNFLGVVSLLTPIAEAFERRRHGTIVAIASVAGDRGRRSNYVYGASKGALALFLQGLRSRLQPSGVRVITVKPGFVDTPMTAHLPKGLLFASPASVARGILRAIERGRDVVYLPWFWRPIMTVIRLVPERLFKRLEI
jgi:short-subunit dehydrogenase